MDIAAIRKTPRSGGFLVDDMGSEDCLSEYPALEMRDAIVASDWRTADRKHVKRIIHGT